MLKDQRQPNTRISQDYKWLWHVAFRYASAAWGWRRVAQTTGRLSSAKLVADVQAYQNESERVPRCR